MNNTIMDLEDYREQQHTSKWIIQREKLDAELKAKDPFWAGYVTGQMEMLELVEELRALKLIKNESKVLQLVNAKLNPIRKIINSIVPGYYQD